MVRPDDLKVPSNPNDSVILHIMQLHAVRFIMCNMSKCAVVLQKRESRGEGICCQTVRGHICILFI